MVALTPELVMAVLGSEGIASVIAAVSATRAHKNSKQLERNHGSSVADAVARIEANQEVLRLGQVAHDRELKQVHKRVGNLESSLLGVRDELNEERKTRRREFAALEEDIENTFSRKESEL